MPLYEYECTNCDTTRTAFKSVAKRNEVQVCGCGSMMIKKITNSRVFGDLDYVEEDLSVNPIRVKGKKHLRELMREHQVVEKFGKGWI